MKNSLRSWTEPSKIIVLSPVIFLLHVTEEAPGFVEWFNSLVRDDITSELFLQVNLIALIITIATAVVTTTMPARIVVIWSLVWLSFLMFANALLHLSATAVHARYSPGTVTAILFYLPYFSWFLNRTRRRYQIGRVTLITVVGLGSLPMLAHGYLVVFKGSRLI